MRLRARALAWIAIVVACADGTTAPIVDREVDGGGWKTWVIASGSALRPAAPAAAGSSQEKQELDDIVTLQKSRTAATNAAIARWSGSPTKPWHDLALDRMEVYWVLLPDVRTATPARTARAFALLNVAMYDALVAAWDAKYAFNRKSPAETDARVVALAPTHAVPTYPSEHAAVAAAAAAVLSYVFAREDTLAFYAMMREAGDARVAAGASYRSDVDAGYEIGRRVAAQVLALARADGSADAWTGTVPLGESMWRPTPNKFVAPPFDANAGDWRTWVIANGRTFRLGPPPDLRSAEFKTNIDELRALTAGRTVEQANIARYWATDAPSAKWEMFMRDEVAHRGLPTLHAARAHALVSVAMYDAFIACWDSKFHYWLYRPVSADASLTPVFPTPPFPSYPSGHSTISSAAAEVFSELFPDSAVTYRAKAREASLSRVYAAVHYRFDVDSGDVLGERVGQAVVNYMKHDGAR